MVTIIQIFYLLIGIYSIVGGIIILFSYMDQRTESKKQFKKTNRKYLRKLVIYTLIVIVPIIFGRMLLDILDLIKKSIPIIFMVCLLSQHFCGQMH